MGTALAAIFLLFFFPPIFFKGGMPNLHEPFQIIALSSFLIAQVGILLAWRWEGIGGLLALIGLILFFVFQYLWLEKSRSIFMFLIWRVPVIMFLYCWLKTKTFSSNCNNEKQISTTSSI